MMITKFDSLYAGHVNKQDVGYGRTAVNDRVFGNAHLAGATERLNIGCGFNIAPMWHPLRLAKDYATADILTGGRVIFGMGGGYHSREIDTFGSPLFDQSGNRDLFEEQVAEQL